MLPCRLPSGSSVGPATIHLHAFPPPPLIWNSVGPSTNLAICLHIVLTRCSANAVRRYKATKSKAASVREREGEGQGVDVVMSSACANARGHTRRSVEESSRGDGVLTACTCFVPLLGQRQGSVQTRNDVSPRTRCVDTA